MKTDEELKAEWEKDALELGLLLMSTPGEWFLRRKGRLGYYEWEFEIKGYTEGGDTALEAVKKGAKIEEEER